MEAVDHALVDKPEISEEQTGVPDVLVKLSLFGLLG
jgi:hypothetical protein